jgi:putative membrane protein
MAHLLTWLLSRFELQVMCLLTGVVFGALIRVWPWQDESAAGWVVRLPSADGFWLPFGLACVGFTGGWLALWFGGQNETKDVT